METSQIKIKIHEIAKPKPGDPQGTPLKVRFKVSEVNDFHTSDRFFNHEIQIPVEEIGGLSKEEQSVLIQKKIKEKIDSSVVKRENDLKGIEALEGEEFDLKPEVEEIEVEKMGN